MGWPSRELVRRQSVFLFMKERTQTTKSYGFTFLVRGGRAELLGRGVAGGSSIGWVQTLAVPNPRAQAENRASLAGDHRGDDYLSTLEASLNREQLESATRDAPELRALRRASLREMASIR
jgi:hypothetical protein